MSGAANAARKRPLTVPELETVRIVNDARVAVELNDLAHELEGLAEAADCLLGGDGLADRVRVARKRVVRLLQGESE